MEKIRFIWLQKMGKLKLSKLSDNSNAPNENGETPIHVAASKGHTEIFKILASLTGNPNAPNYIGITPIHCAVNNGHTEIVKYLASLNMRK